MAENTDRADRLHEWHLFAVACSAPVINVCGNHKPGVCCRCGFYETEHDRG